MAVVLLVHGYDGSGQGHWQRWLFDELRRRQVDVRFPELPEPLAPQKSAWVAALGDVVARADEPVICICHSLGCWALDHLLAERGAQGINAALMVAPPSPYLLFEPVDSFLPPPRRREAWAAIAPRSRLVGSDNDEFTSAEEFQQIARTLGIECTIVAGGGHINVDSGYGPWVLPLEWLRAQHVLNT